MFPSFVSASEVLEKWNSPKKWRSLQNWISSLQRNNYEQDTLMKHGIFHSCDYLNIKFLWNFVYFIQYLFSICRSWRLREICGEVHECHSNCNPGGQPDHQFQVLYSSGRLLSHFPRSCYWRYPMARNSIRKYPCSYVVLVHRPGEVCACGMCINMFVVLMKNAISVLYTHI